MQLSMQRRKSIVKSVRIWGPSRFLAAAATPLLAGFLTVSAGPEVAAEGLRVAALTPGTDMPRETALPKILPGGDLTRYRAILSAQAEGRWADADQEIRALGDRMLLGHVLAQRYLHRDYRARYDELCDWLSHYPDHPEAAELYLLAMGRRPRGAAQPAHPVGSPVPLRGAAEDPIDLRPAARSGVSAGILSLSRSAQMRAAQLRERIHRLAKDDPSAALHLLQGAMAQGLFDDSGYDDALTEIAEAHLVSGGYRAALDLVTATRTPAYKPLGRWLAGLAAWGMGRMGEAAGHFEALARMPNLSSWNVSAAAFWASRSHLRNRAPEQVNRWLAVAADHPRTFYGLLASQILGRRIYFNFESEIFTETDAGVLSGLPAGRRALALLQLGLPIPAELELRILAGRAEPQLIPALVDLADRGNLPALSLQLASMQARVDGRRHDHALYPLPRWQPRDGFTLDRALLFAFARQESEFLPYAESSRGARGLMQLMPATAAEVAEHAGISLNDRRKTPRGLFDPELNLTLGQRYLSELVRSNQIKGNLLLLTAAYNGGPANLERWKTRPEYRADPLFFIETLPKRETRVFTQRVMTNYWVYRLRLGQKTGDLDMLAGGTWPIYTALDTRAEPETRHAASR